MCLNPKLIQRSGNRVQDNYNGKKGEYYEIETFAKCGHCEQCVNEKSNNWVIRNFYESKAHKSKCFITLTYKNNPKFLIKEHLQLFLKRLRRELEYYKKIRIRFFACGEYGTLNGRPHFHIIVYGWEENKDNLFYERVNKKGNPILTSATINKLWKYGIHSYQKFESHEIPYITLYNTPNEEISRQYYSTKESMKKWLEEEKKIPLNKVKTKEDKKWRKEIIKQISRLIKEAERLKQDYIKIKEFNTWSKALGFEKFYENYIDDQKFYNWREYIEDKEFLTPSPWVKKLANLGDEYAIKEMLLRSQELNSRLDENHEQAVNINKSIYQHAQKVFENLENIYEL